MKPELTDSRRLTGGNLFWDLPSAIIDVRFDADPAGIISAWSRAAKSLLEAIGREQENVNSRTFSGGFSLLISAPVDVLYSMCELNEAAFEQALAETGYGESADLTTSALRLKKLFDEESNPRLIALQAAAHDHGVPFLWDDDAVSVGYGRTAQVWTPDQLPEPGDIDWSAVGSIPVALVTGTNGKSTTVRMSASIIAAQGLRAGLTSTDWIRIGETILDTGDYSGTGGARTLMRHRETEVAVLETARGGLLRRGLGVERAAAALITNVAADHLGEYGINTVGELMEAKFIVRRALEQNAPLILNADDQGMVAYAQNLDNNITWFSLDPENELIQGQIHGRGNAAVLLDDYLVLIREGVSRKIIAAADIPACMEGAARHNIQNALGAMALCNELGISDDAIRKGLAGFRGDEQDNPGRGNWFRKGDTRILVDFAHNVHGVTALGEMIARIPARRRMILIGQAGDRLDNDIIEMTQAACRMNPDLVLPCELPGYERGRPQSDVTALISDAAISSGMQPENLRCFGSPLEAAAFALENSCDGDLMVFLALTQRQEVIDLVHKFVSE